LPRRPGHDMPSAGDHSRRDCLTAHPPNSHRAFGSCWACSAPGRASCRPATRRRTHCPSSIGTGLARWAAPSRAPAQASKSILRSSRRRLVDNATYVDAFSTALAEFVLQVARQQQGFPGRVLVSLCATPALTTAPFEHVIQLTHLIDVAVGVHLTSQAVLDVLVPAAREDAAVRPLHRPRT
jgi:hypothetical protein